MLVDPKQESIETVVDRIQQKLKQLNVALLNPVKDATGLIKLFSDVGRALSELHEALNYGYYQLASSKESDQIDLAKECSEAGCAVVGFLRKVELYSEYIPNAHSDGYQPILSYFQELFKEVNKYSGIKIISEINNGFKSSSPKFSKLIIGFIDINY